MHFSLRYGASEYKSTSRCSQLASPLRPVGRLCGNCRPLACILSTKARKIEQPQEKELCTFHRFIDVPFCSARRPIHLVSASSGFAGVVRKKTGSLLLKMCASATRQCGADFLVITIKLACEEAYLFALARDHFSSIRSSVTEVAFVLWP